MRKPFAMHIHRIFGIIATALVMSLLAMAPLRVSAGMEKPTGNVILSISGAITETNAGSDAIFDRDMLRALGMHSLITTNPFETGLQRFEGVLLSDVLKHTGATGKTIIAHALDGYTVEIPAADATRYPVLLAMVWNGQEMTVRNKGPLWVVYPVDQFDELKKEIFSIRSIWQLTRLTIKE